MGIGATMKKCAWHITGSMPDPAPEEAGKRRAAKHHCDTPAAGSESEGVRRLWVETRRTQRTRRNAEAAVSAPIRRLCGHAMLARPNRPQQALQPAGRLQRLRFHSQSTLQRRKPPRGCASTTRRADTAPHLAITSRERRPPRDQKRATRLHPRKFARRCAAFHSLSMISPGHG